MRSGEEEEGKERERSVKREYLFYGYILSNLFEHKKKILSINIP